MSNIDKNELKVQALLERIAQLTAEYENKVADLRVELTTVSHERDTLADASEKSEKNKSS